MIERINRNNQLVMRNAKAHIPPIAYHGPEDSMATRKTKAATAAEAPTETKVIAYKGFNPDWTCNPPT